MKKARFLLVMTLAVAGATAVALGVLAPTVAAAAETQKVSSAVAKPLRAAQEAMGQKNWEEALAKVKEAQAVENRTPYDNFMIEEMGWYSLLQMKDYAAAATMLEDTVNSGFVAPEELPKRLKALSQLNYQTQNYAKAAEFGTRYLAAAPGDQDIEVLVAQSYYLEKDYAAARDYVQKTTAGSAEPAQQLLVIALSSSFKLNDRPGTIKALESLVRYYPEKKYWEDLLTNQLYETKGDRELRTLYRLMEQTDTLDKPDEFSEMGSTLLAGGFPAEAARILQQGLSAKLFSGDALARVQADLQRAQNGAAADAKDLPGAGKALAAAKTGNEMVAVGKLYFSSAEYAKAADAIRMGLAKGGVADTDDANALLGIALIRAGTQDAARAAFTAIADPKYASVARLWILYLDSSNKPAETATTTETAAPPAK
jgi:hypothetical protein